MTRNDDPMEILTRLEPVAFGRLAEKSYARRRHDDLARFAAEAPARRTTARSGAGLPARRSLAGTRSRWALASAGMTAVVAAAAAVAITVTVTAGPSRPRPAHQPTAAHDLSARGFLLASARVISRSPQATGQFWYVKERDFSGPVAAAKPSQKHKPLTAPGRKPVTPPPTFGANYAATEESWTGAGQARTIVGEDLQFTFATSADKAAWQAAGSPPLTGPSGRPGVAEVTTNYADFQVHWGYGVTHNLTLAQVEKLPTTPSALDAVLRQMWNTEPDRAGATGSDNPAYGQYVFGWASQLLPGPATSGTKAALYQLLAGQPGLTITQGVTDPMGRTGTAVSAGTAGSETLVIDPATAAVLDDTIHLSTIPAGDTTAYLAMGWTNQIGVPAQP
jgi:hypothetical protein